MAEYLCPSCEGGFPASLGTDDACPWCGERMDGATGDADRHPVPQPLSERLSGRVPPHQLRDKSDTDTTLPFNPERSHIDEESIAGRDFMFGDAEMEQAAEFASELAADLAPSQAASRPAYDHGLGARAGDLE